MGVFVRTTLDLPDETFRQLKSQAPSYPIPIAREADGTVTPYLTNAQLHALLEEEDLVQYQRVLGGASGQ